MRSASIVLVGVALLAACSELGGPSDGGASANASSRFGDDPEPEVLRAAVERAAETAERAVTGRYVMTVEHGGDHPSPGLTGTFDTAAGSVRAEMAVRGEVAQTLLVVRGLSYTFVRPEDRGPLGLRTPWVLLDDTDEPDPIHGEWAPFALLDLLRGQTGSTVVVGSEEIGGVPTAHLRVEVIPAEAAQSLAPALADRLRAEFGERFDARVEVDVWVDGADQARRIRAPWQTGIGEVPLVAELHDLGEPIQIDAPPDVEVTRLSDLDLPNGRSDIFAPGGR